MKKSILTRQLLIISISLALAISIIVFFVVRTGNRILVDKGQQHLLSKARFFSSLLPDTLDEHSAQSLAVHFKRITGTRFTIVAPDGRVIADSDENPKTMENHFDRPEIIDAVAKGIGLSSRYSKTVKEQTIYSAIARKDNDDNILYIVRASEPFEIISKFRFLLLRNTVLIALLIFVAIILIMAFSRKIIENEINLLGGTMRRIAEGDFNARDEETKSSEFAPLSASINSIAERLGGFFSEIEKEKNKLISLIESLNEGVILIGEDGRIELVNNIAGDFLGEDIKSIMDKDALSFFRISAIRELIIRDKDETKEFDLGNKRFQAGISKTLDRKKRIIVIRDITEQFNVQKNKSDFVANVSHELKTPLTLIKGYSETLEFEELKPEQMEYVSTIIRHTNRMIAIVDDLLTLSRIEEQKYTNFVPIDLSSLVRGIAPIFANLQIEKRVEIRYELLDKIPKIIGDRNLLEIAISNLLDNAVKYNIEDGKVMVRTSLSNGKVVLEVSDTGIGIPDEDVNRIFERFYTVDKAHTHEIGGTGLGLSIVKHIVIIHDAEISVRSVLGKGTSFKLQFKPVDAS